ncbi:hypothetical protein [Spelaeicoccus albus]|uniref:Uncharacterized protein n=1 Tax=Spelaeicoccus albus TaxID=1280376 RepID=A0A7Z0IHY6_9MICO|nr:hypothetical protein [Spelaeicoccus albus]NYI68045.1 hypothetical protein [Spelaeicoccus albus]
MSRESPCARHRRPRTGSAWRIRAGRWWGEFVGPEATPTNDVLTAATALFGAAVAPAIVRRRGGTRLGALIAVGLAGDLVGGAYVNNTRACARWYERPGQGVTEHLIFAALHVHPAVVAWMDRDAAKRIPGPWWALAHYSYMLGSAAAIQRYRSRRRTLGVILTIGGIALDRAIGSSHTAPWLAWTYYPKLLLGHAAAAAWSDDDLAVDDVRLSSRES